MTDPLMARMASQMRQSELATLANAMDAAVASGDTAEVRKLSDRRGELMAQEAAMQPQPKFQATDVRAAIARLAPDAVKDLNLRQKLSDIANNIAKGMDISDFESPEELARSMLKAAGYAVADPTAAKKAEEEAAAKKKAEEEAAAKKKAEEEAAARAAADEDGENEDDENEDDENEDDEDDDEEDDAARAAAERRRKPARQSREEPSLGTGRPASATRSLDKATKVTDLPKESREGWNRMVKGGMQTVANAAAAGDEAAKAAMTKAEKSYVDAEVRRLKAMRKTK